MGTGSEGGRVSKLRVLDLFSGIGGFSLGLERTGGFETVAFCEIEDYPRKVLAKHWPGVPIYDDVRNLTAERLAIDGIGVDVITGGFPCQDISIAGKQAGIGGGTRSGLWSEIARLIGELRPQYAIMENVTALLSGDSGRWFGRILGDLAEIGYDAEWHCIPASELGANHHRDRVWIVAHPCGDRKDEFREGGIVCNELRECSQTKHQRDELEYGSGRYSDVADTGSNGSQGIRKNRRATRQTGLCGGAGWDEIKNLLRDTSGWAVEPAVGRVANGISARSHRLKGLGNAVVPQIPELIGRAILEAQ